MKAPNNCKFAVVYVIDLSISSKHKTKKAVKKAYLKKRKESNLYIIGIWNNNLNEYDSTTEGSDLEWEAIYGL